MAETLLYSVYTVAYCLSKKTRRLEQLLLKFFMIT